MADMNDILSRIERLPALPASVLQLTAMLTDGRAHLGELEAIARRDEALTAAILRCGNSARYGRPGRVFDLRESLVRLGGKTLLKLVLEHKVAGMFKDAGAAYGLMRGAMWRGSLGGAIATELLSDRIKSPDADVCFLCAMLRDVGKLALDAHYGPQYISLVSAHLRADRTFVEAERAALGYDHAALGAELASRWGLPQRLCDAIRHHHEPPENPPLHDNLFDLVHAGDIICLWAGLAVGYDGLQYRLAPHVRMRLRLDRHEAETDIAQTWARLRELEEFMFGSAPKENIA